MHSVKSEARPPHIQISTPPTTLRTLLPSILISVSNMEGKSSPIPVSKRRITSNVAAALEGASEYVLPVGAQGPGGSFTSTTWSINEAAAKAEAESGVRPATLHVGRGEYVLDYGELNLSLDDLSILGEVGEDGVPLTSIVGRIRIAGATDVRLENLVITSRGTGICIDEGATCTLRNCHVIGCGASGVYICDASIVTMDACDVEQNALYGIYVTGKGSSAKIKYSSVTGTGRALCVCQGGQAHLEGTVPTLEGGSASDPTLPSPLLIQDARSAITQSKTKKDTTKFKTIKRRQSFVAQQKRIEERDVRLRPEGLPQQDRFRLPKIAPESEEHETR